MTREVLTQTIVKTVKMTRTKMGSLAPSGWPVPSPPIGLLPLTDASTEVGTFTSAPVSAVPTAVATFSALLPADAFNVGALFLRALARARACVGGRATPAFNVHSVPRSRAPSSLFFR